MAKYIVVIGPPGAGKGTQAQIIAEKLRMPHVSSGDIFRENLNKKTELGVFAKSYIDRGDLVPDDVTISMIQTRLSEEDCSEGAVLDGFPRTPTQASALAAILKGLNEPDIVVPCINVDENILIERLTGRSTCREQGHIFHESFNPPKLSGICDHDGSPLYQRDDDSEKTVKKRIQVYYRQTRPLIEYYQDQGLLVKVDGNQNIKKVTQDLITAITQFS